MKKSLNCADVGVDCDFSMCADTENQILKKAKKHAKEAHNMDEIPKDLYEKARGAIRDVESC